MPRPRRRAAPTRGDRGRLPQPAWWRHPWAIRARAVRRRLLARPSGAAGQTAALAAALAAAGSDPFPPGAVLVFPGEHDRHDFARLTALKRAKRLRFALVFYDLLRVLDDGDPRLRDPVAGDLPPSDFLVREADLALPISRCSAAAVRDHVARPGVAGPAVVPIRLGCDVEAGMGEAVAGLEPGRFVLSVGDVVHRKNHALLVAVWRHLGREAPVLVIAGRVDREGDARAAAIRGDAWMRRVIRILPDLGDACLVWLYRQCRFTVFPSLLEGFGLPVAESLGFGKVCVASNAASVPEAGQGAAISLDPRDVAGWEAAVQGLMDDGALRAAEARIGAVFRRVSWADTAAEIVSACNDLCGAA